MPATGTLDSVAYLYLGLAVVAVVMVLLIARMVLRYRNLEKDAQMLEQFEIEDRRAVRR